MKWGIGCLCSFGFVVVALVGFALAAPLVFGIGNPNLEKIGFFAFFPIVLVFGPLGFGIGYWLSDRNRPAPRSRQRPPSQQE